MPHSSHETSHFSAACMAHVCYVPPAPFQNALKPSSLKIFQKQSITPLYVVWPARAATCRRVLITSAGVTREAAGTPKQGMFSYPQYTEDVP